MTVEEALFSSWDRQCRVIDNLLGRFRPEDLHLKPDEDGWTIAFHLAHVHGVRRFWHMNAAGLEEPVGASLYAATGDDWADWVPTYDLQTIRARLAESGALVRDWAREALAAGVTKAGNYDHPVLYLQHMIWHEGWHVGLIMLALRRGGQEPPEEWEDAHVWDLWRLPG
ncbi:MAG TPA: DinB family protein [Fimbriimonadaceae bacterium]|nr:DinB family protein [Fimbriimonadaceae bacterium]